MTDMTYRARWEVLDLDMTMDQLRNEATAWDLPDLLYESGVQQIAPATWSLDDGKAAGVEPGLYLVADVPVALWHDPVLSRNRRASMTGGAR